MNLPIYLDYNATTPVDPRVLETMLPYFTQNFGNAASKTHAFGWQAEGAVEEARKQVATLIGSDPVEIVFTSGATEAINLAIKGVFETYASKGKHIITCVAEHKAVLDTCKHIEKQGGTVTYLPVNEQGLINLDTLEKAIQPDTILIAIMYANNETGVIQPIKEISSISKKYHVLFFTDATQAVGKLPVNVHTGEIDLMACSGHKIYGPKGVGALYVRRKNPRVKLIAQMDGGGHERGMRSGTLNVPGITGFGKACELCFTEMEKEGNRLKILRDKLEHNLLQITGSFLNGAPLQRLPHVCNLSFKPVTGISLISTLANTIAVSSGSACNAASPEPSHVLKAMGRHDELAYNAIRFSLGRFTTEAEIDYVIETFRAISYKL